MRGQPRRAVPPATGRTLQLQRGPALPEPPGAPRQGRSARQPVRAFDLPDATGGPGRAPGPSIPPRPPTPSSARAEGQLPEANRTRRPSRLWPPNLTAPEPSSNLPGWVQSFPVLLVHPRAPSPSAPILELRTCARDCATAKNSPGRGGAWGGGGGGNGEGGAGGYRAQGEAVGWGKLILAGLSRSSCW